MGLMLATSLAGCYAYPAGYRTYGSYQAYPAYGYPAYGYGGGYPYDGGYGGAVIIGGGDYGGYRHGYDHDDGRPRGGFNGRPGPGFAHPEGRPGGFSGGFHPGGSFGSHH
jgi:hypothetical protein